MIVGEELPGSPVDDVRRAAAAVLMIIMPLPVRAHLFDSERHARTSRHSVYFNVASRSADLSAFQILARYIQCRLLRRLQQRE
jgi:hypothetical protein